MNRSLLIISLLCLCLLLYPIQKGYSYGRMESYEPRNDLKEAYEPTLFIRLQNMESLFDYIEGTYHGNKHSVEFVNHIGSIISRRFYHGYSYYSDQDNWIASLAGNFIWKDLSAIVVPDDIMKHPDAACSQQTIIMMECARHFGFKTRKVTFDHHFTSEVKVNNKWHFIDPNMEVTAGKSLRKMLREKSFLALYKNKFGDDKVQNILANPVYGKANEIVAQKSRMFQSTTSWISINFIMILSIIMAFIFFYYLQKENMGFPARKKVLKTFLP